MHIQEYNILKVLLQDSGENISEFETKEHGTILICTAQTSIHLHNITEKLRKHLKQLKVSILNVEHGNSWSLISIPHCIVHIMTKEKREYMDLESLFSVQSC